MGHLPRTLGVSLGQLVVVLVAMACAVASPTSASAQQAEGEYVQDDEGPPQEMPVGVDGDTYSDTDPSALTDFRATLDPHGSWVDDPTYGTEWIPNQDEVGPDFAPYVSDGSWAYDDDYLWVSNYEWGWVPFHYGRWAWTGGRGWGWIPGRQYAGAWVTWRTGPEGYGYVGWGPRAPAFGWRSGVAYGLGAEVASRPTPVAFVARESMFVPRVGARVVVGDQVRVIASETRPYVRQEPVAPGHPVAQGVMHGPTPPSLGIPWSAVVRANPNERGAMQARAYARPSTAQTFGARAPSAHFVRVRRGSGAVHGGTVNVAAPAPRAVAAPRGGTGRGGRR
jgi:hypothetical protein